MPQPRDPQAARARRSARASLAATEIVGSLLMAGLTAGMMALAFGSFLVVPKPTDAPLADLALSAGPGPDGAWDTGDEVLLVVHRGGQSIHAEGAEVVYSVAGAPEVRLGGATLGGAFADGALSIGERWERTLTLPAAAQFSVQVVAANTVLASTGFVPAEASCATDTSPPTVAAWTQAPPDVRSVTAGPVVVMALLADDCAGVLDLPPALHWRFADEPAFQDISMAAAGPGLWAASIPDPGWAAAATRTLEYHVAPLQDARGNVGGSANRTDLVDLVGFPTFVGAAMPLLGQVLDFANARNDTDGGAEARLLEANTAPPGGALTLLANQVVAAGTGWTNASDALADDGAEARNAANSPGDLVLGFDDPATSSAAITGVVARAELRAEGGDDAFRLRACLGAVCSAPSGLLGGAANATLVSYDLLRPGGGPWTWDDLRALNLTLTPVKTGSRDGTWRVDHALLEVAYAPPPVYVLDVQMNFTGVLPGTQHRLELRWRTTGDSFQVWVHDGAAWNLRAALDPGAPPQVLSLPLSGTEWAAFAPGAPRVRFVGLTADASQGTLFLDWLKVLTVVGA